MIHKAELFNGWMHVEHSAPAEPGSPQNRCRLRAKPRCNNRAQRNTSWVSANNQHLASLATCPPAPKKIYINKYIYNIKSDNKMWLAQTLLRHRVTWGFSRPVMRKLGQMLHFATFFFSPAFIQPGDGYGVQPKLTRALGDQSDIWAPQNVRAARSWPPSPIRTTDRGRGCQRLQRSTRP